MKLNEVTTLEQNEILTDFIRSLATWTRTRNVPPITYIQFGNITLDGKKEIEDFRTKICFIRDYLRYNDEWAGILNDFKKWYTTTYENIHGKPYQPRIRHNSIEEMLSQCYMNRGFLPEFEEKLKKEIW